MKFWKRTLSGSLSDFDLIDCFVLDERVAFIRSTLGQFHEETVPSTLLESEEILCVKEVGTMDVYFMDRKRKSVLF